jgi:GTP cyclohydrolase I
MGGTVSTKTHLSVEQVAKLASDTAMRISTDFQQPNLPVPPLLLYGVPRGGVPAAMAVATAANLYGFKWRLTSDPGKADAIVDDIVDSGSTQQLHAAAYPRTPFYALINKQKTPDLGWVVFPWEQQNEKSTDDTIVGTLRNRGCVAAANGSALVHPITESEMVELEAEVANRYQGVLDALLIDTANDHNTAGTAKRYAKLMVREVMCGRFTPPPPITVFPNTKKLDELYVTGPNTLRSMCSHHCCPIIGQFWIGVLPGEKLLGLSKFNRVVQWLAARGQIQEELTVQIADELECLIEPRGLAVVVRAQHTCMTWRGVMEGGDSMMTTSVVRGVLRENASAKAEFMKLCGL